MLLDPSWLEFQKATARRCGAKLILLPSELLKSAINQYQKTDIEICRSDNVSGQPQFLQKLEKCDIGKWLLLGQKPASIAAADADKARS